MAAKAAADFLRQNIPLRNAVQMGKRVEYFRGKKLVECLMESTSKGKPECPTRAEAARIGMMLLRYGYTHASEVVDKRRRMLQPIKSLRFDPDGQLTMMFTTVVEPPFPFNRMYLEQQAKVFDHIELDLGDRARMGPPPAEHAQ